MKLVNKNTSACGDFCVLAPYVLCWVFWGGRWQGQYVWAKCQPGESTPAKGQLEGLPSHRTVRILVHDVVIELIEDFLSFSVYFFFSYRML